MAGNREARMGSLTTFWTNASYKSFGRPHLLEGDADDAGLESGFPRSSLHTRASSIHTRASSIGESGHSSLFKSKSDKRTPSAKYTLRQLLYIFGSHGIGAMVISGVINFVIAYAMYTKTDVPIYLFELPNTLVGDFAVTTIMQTIVTWLMEMLIVNHDLRKGNVQPIGFIAPPTKLLARWFLLPGDTRLMLAPPPPKRWRARLLNLVAQVIRALVVSVVLVAVLIGPTIGILLALGEKSGGDWVYASRWTPQAFKGILGGGLALFTTPPMAMMWMVKCGWSRRLLQGSPVVNGYGYGRQ